MDHYIWLLKYIHNMAACILQTGAPRTGAMCFFYLASEVIPPSFLQYPIHYLDQSYLMWGSEGITGIHLQGWLTQVTTP